MARRKKGRAGGRNSPRLLLVACPDDVLAAGSGIRGAAQELLRRLGLPQAGGSRPRCAGRRGALERALHEFLPGELPAILHRAGGEELGTDGGVAVSYTHLTLPTK